MTVEISSEAYQALQAQVNEGLYASVDEAANNGILQSTVLTQATADPEYVRYVQECIKEGLADLEAGRVVPASEVLADLRSRLSS